MHPACDSIISTRAENADVIGRAARDIPVLQLVVVDSDFDADTRIDQADKGRWHPDEVAGPTVRSARVSRNVGDQSTADDEGGLRADDTEVVHGVHDLEHSLYTSSEEKECQLSS